MDLLRAYNYTNKVFRKDEMIQESPIRRIEPKPSVIKRIDPKPIEATQLPVRGEIKPLLKRPAETAGDQAMEKMGMGRMDRVAEQKREREKTNLAQEGSLDVAGNLRSELNTATKNRLSREWNSLLIQNKTIQEHTKEARDYVSKAINAGVNSQGMSEIFHQFGLRYGQEAVVDSLDFMDKLLTSLDRRFGQR